ncbi:unnamed protein product [Cunninghamella blakesleeana]
MFWGNPKKLIEQRKMYKQRVYNLLKNKCNVIFDRSSLYKNTVVSICRQLNITPPPFHHIVNYQSLKTISRLAKYNIIVTQQNLYPYYYGAEEFKIAIIEYVYFVNMIICTSFKEETDNEEQISYILENIDQLKINKLKDAYYEYILSIEHKYLKDIDLFDNYNNDISNYFYKDYEKDSNKLYKYPGMKYNAITTISTSIVDHGTIKINNNKPMLLSDYILLLLRHMYNADSQLVLIYENDYYYFGNKGRGITFAQLHKDGSITIPNITNLKKYCHGDLHQLMKLPIYLL